MRIRRLPSNPQNPTVFRCERRCTIDRSNEIKERYIPDSGWEQAESSEKEGVLRMRMREEERLKLLSRERRDLPRERETVVGESRVKSVKLRMIIPH